ncbi:MAG: outer membrane protein assembly factor BamE [Hydrogenovibrio sp.]|nr:outer membrane protein assembly factor BamE [Hydrogenovibrio sp.]
MVSNLKKIPHTTALKLFSAAMLSALLSGCSFFMPYKAPVTQGTVINQEALNTLQAGLTMGQVKQILGPPMGQDPFYPRHWEYVFYTTDKAFDPHAVHHLIVSFDSDNYLDSWKVVDQKVKID